MLMTVMNASIFNRILNYTLVRDWWRCKEKVFKYKF